MRKPLQPITLEKEVIPLELRDNPWGTELSRKFDDYSKAIGQFLIAFSCIETHLDRALIDALYKDKDYDGQGLRIAKYLSFSEKVQLYIEIDSELVGWLSYRSFSKVMRRKLKILDIKLNEQGQFRNKIAHARWLTLNKTGFVRIKVGEKYDSDYQGGIRFENAKITPKIIMKFTRQAFALRTRIDSFGDELEDYFDKDLDKLAGGRKPEQKKNLKDTAPF